MKVSIITPCLNSAKTIRQAIESVLNQTYQNIEYIVVDGGSTDSTLDIIKEYQPKFHGRMRVISEKDKGIYDAMNKGIRLTHGGLIGIVNSDDYYELDAVENVVAHMTDDRYQVVYGYCRVFNNRYTIEIVKADHTNLADKMIPHATCFVTRAVYCDYGMYRTALKITSDYELMLRLLCSEKVVFTQIQQIIANFRVGGASSNAERVEREHAIIAFCYKLISFKVLALRMLGFTG